MSSDFFDIRFQDGSIQLEYCYKFGNIRMNGSLIGGNRNRHTTFAKNPVL